MNATACPRCVDHRLATFHVAEMDCAHEVAILEKRLATLTGVVTLDADVLSRQLRVHFDGATQSAAGIAEAVAQTVAADLGIDRFFAGVRPEDKAAKVQELTEVCRENGSPIANFFGIVVANSGRAANTLPACHAPSVLCSRNCTM